MNEWNNHFIALSASQTYNQDLNFYFQKGQFDWIKKYVYTAYKLAIPIEVSH